MGWDAADWKVIHPLMEAGKMPNVRRLVENGARGQMTTLQPPLSPMLWTSIATGKRPFKHGIHGFSEPAPDGRGVQPVTNLSRKSKALWKWRIGLDRGGLFPRTFCDMGWRGILHRWNVGARTGATAIEHGRTALVIGVIFGSFLLLVVRRGAFDGVGHRICVPDRSANARFGAVLTMAIAIVVAIVVKAIPCRR